MFHEFHHIYRHIIIYERNIWARKFTGHTPGRPPAPFPRRARSRLEKHKTAADTFGHVVYMPQLLHILQTVRISSHASRVLVITHMRTDALVCTVRSVARLKLYILSSESQVVLTD